MNTWLRTICGVEVVLLFLGPMVGEACAPELFLLNYELKKIISYPDWVFWCLKKPDLLQVALFYLVEIPSSADQA